MKNKKLALVALTAGLSVLSCIPAFASGWQKDTVGWWYTLNNDNTNWYESGWVWIDGNKDGIAERYYFNSNGYVAVNTTINGEQVDGSGAWVVNGVVQVRTDASGGDFDGMLVPTKGTAFIQWLQKDCDLDGDGKLVNNEYWNYMYQSGEPFFVTTSEERKQSEKAEAERQAYLDAHANEPDTPLDLDQMQKEIDEWTYQEAVKRMGGQ